VFCFLVVGLIFMDAETGLLPHEFTYTGILLGFAFAWVVAPFDVSGTVLILRAFGLRELAPGPGLWLLDAAVAAAFGAGFFYVAWGLYYLVRKREGIGLGDIALIAMVGAFLGLKLTILVVFLSPILATLFAFSLLFENPTARQATYAPEASGGDAANSFLSRAVPFGVFLGSSALVALLFGEKIWTWYLGMFR
jgi:leader peptidase (prepilin peptidase)/N-methyltransferase